MKRILTLFAALLVCAAAFAKLQLRQPCSDGMVLQQQALATVWGKADPGSRVTVVPSWDKRKYTAEADAEGFWQLAVQTPAASYTPHTLTVKSGSDRLLIRDVLVGEVWFASGQSNMEMPIRGFYGCPVEGAADVLTAAPLRDRVRMFKVPRTRSYEPVSEVEAEWWRADATTVAEMSATGFFFARKLNETLDVPVGILFSAYGGSKVESWLPEEIVRTYPDIRTDRASIEALPFDYYSPFMMYNAMVCPVKGYTVKGFIWYQGCSNVGQEATYADRLEKLVSVWRADWNDPEARLPFYQVEIAPYQYAEGGCAGALLRQAQHAAAKRIPNAGIAVTNDLVYPYELDQIHPARKQEVGERLAYLALHRDYGLERVACYSPEALQASLSPRDPQTVCVRLSECPDGLDRWRGIEGLEVAGADGVFYPVREARTDGATLFVRCDAVPAPRTVRYGWGDFVPGNLHSCAGLPLSPFCLTVE
ncbi:MAG: sialate O-acetylesterase [Bacteroidales bacterium]|jgi:sialate O-acetylesterase|nr:sialate O-acetylesterase [Bacteroidales bacterium]